MKAATSAAPSVAPVPPGRDEAIDYRVWDALVRVTHWLTVVALVALVGTGLYIGAPWPVETPSGLAWMATARIVHFYGALVFSLAVVARLAWLFLGPAPARWRELVPLGPRRWSGLRQTFFFYLFVHRRPPHGVGHNPLAGLVYAMVYGLFLVMIATGLALYAQQAHLDSPLRGLAGLVSLLGGVQATRWVHHGTMWLIIPFAVLHLYCVALISWLTHDRTAWSMVTGCKRLSCFDVEAAERQWRRRG